MCNVDTCHVSEQFPSKVIRPPNYARPKVELTWLRFGQSNQLLDGSYGQRGMYSNYADLSCYLRDWRKVSHRVVRCFSQKRSNPGNATSNIRGISVRRCLGYILC